MRRLLPSAGRGGGINEFGLSEARADALARPDGQETRFVPRHHDRAVHGTSLETDVVHLFKKFIGISSKLSVVRDSKLSTIHIDDSQTR